MKRRKKGKISEYYNILPNVSVLLSRRSFDCEHTRKLGCRSQAALEFLATYGWAFLVILIVIAALSYFGILSPSKLLPNRCSFGSEFGCVDYTLAKSGVQLRLKNNAGQAIIISGVIVSSEKSQLSGCTSPIVGPTPWRSGEVKEVHISCDFTNSGLVLGEKEKLNLKIKYYNVMSSSAFSKEVNGEVYAVMQDILTLTYSNAQEVGVVDDGADSNYKLMKSFQAAKGGSFQLKWQAYIQPGPDWWAYKIAKNNGAVTLNTGYFKNCDDGACSVHQYEQFTDDVSGVNAGDTVELWMVSSTGGGVPVVGHSQTLFAKNFEAYS